MSDVRVRHEQRIEANQRLKMLMDQRETTLLVHYSCEDLSKADGTSPRVTAIAVLNVSTSESRIFSIHLEAERHLLGIDPILTKDDFDKLELAMLKEYFKFVRQNQESRWIHWKMRNTVYGFAAIEHRFDVLGGNPVPIRTEKKYDLSELVEGLYGRDYTKTHPHLTALISLNKITETDLIPGNIEPTVFKDGKYRSLHNSAARKSLVLSTILDLTYRGKLKTDARWKDTHGSSILGAVENWRTNPWFSLTEFVFAIIGIVGTIVTIVMLMIAVA